MFNMLSFTKILSIVLLLVLGAGAGAQMQAQSGQSPAKMTLAIPEAPTDISPLLNGERIPEVTLRDQQGRTVDLKKIVAEKPSVLVFYRGGWCPFCVKQLSGLQEIKPFLDSKGYQIIAISTDSPESLKTSAGKEKLDYTLLSDADGSVAKQFGIAFKAPEKYLGLLAKSTAGQNVEGLLPVPSVFILNRQGVIRFEYINPDFKERISPALLKAVAESIYKEL